MTVLVVEGEQFRTPVVAATESAGNPWAARALLFAAGFVAAVALGCPARRWRWGRWPVRSPGSSGPPADPAANGAGRPAARVSHSTSPEERSGRRTGTTTPRRSQAARRPSAGGPAETG